jgi:hypothetical protein
MDIITLKNRLQSIKQRGYIETHRSGNTGVGKTLEDLLEIEENNREDADLQDLGIEVKSARSDSENMLTLFSKEPPRSERQFWYRELIREAGYVDDKGRKVLKCTLSYEKPNNQGLYTEAYNNGISINHNEHGVCARYPIEVIENKAEDRFPRLLLVDAKRKQQNGTEMFYYTDAVLYFDFSFDSFVDLMEESKCVIEIRMHLKDGGGVRNRGTAWRLKKEKYLKDMFSESTRLL